MLAFVLFLLGIANAASQQGQVNMLTWPSTAFAPPDAATQSFVPNINLTNFVGDYSSARIFGAISTSLPADLITFTIRTDGGVLLWVDDHLIGESPSDCCINGIDLHLPCHIFWYPAVDSSTLNSDRVLTASLNVSFVNATQTFKLDYLHYTGPSILQLFWEGNFTSSGIVPSSAFTSDVTTQEQQRIALRDRMMNPSQPWQTYSNPTMGCHVHMPEVSLDCSFFD